jgi:hypothetical protein
MKWKFFLVLQKQVKMKQNKMCFASFRFEAKIKKEQKRDTLVWWYSSFKIKPVPCYSI